MSPLFACLLLSAGYVAPFYVAPPKLERNHPSTIRRRLVCTFGYCCVAWIPVWLLLDDQGLAGFCAKLGLRRIGLLPALILPLLLTATLFLGPLAMQALTPQRRLHRVWDLTAWRDLVAAPITEEFIFRSLLLTLLIGKGFAPPVAVAIVPLFFGVAHLHHLYNLVQHQQIPAFRALCLVGFQFLYTTAFGWYAAWLLLRTGHLAAPVAAHAFCNLMGVPDFGSVLKSPHKKLIAALFVLGVVLFGSLLNLLTQRGFYVP